MNTEHGIIAERRIMRFEEPLALECGGTLSDFELAFELYGQPDCEMGNVILVCHTLSTNAHAAGRHKPQDERAGWWDAAIGPGRVLDTDRHCVLCISVIGGCGGSSGPGSLDPATGKRYGISFPVVTIGDMVNAQKMLADRLGLTRFQAVVGGCMGGFQALEWMTRFPEMIPRAILIGTSPASSPHTIACNSVIRECIMSDPFWNNGAYYDSEFPTRGMGLAAMTGMLIWMNHDIMDRKYGRMRIDDGNEHGFKPEFAIEEMLERVRKNSSGRFDPNAMLYLTRAMDYFDITAGHASLEEALKPATASTLLISYSSDWRYPPGESERIAEALRANGRQADTAILESEFGHGAFLFDTEALRPYFEAILA